MTCVLVVDDEPDIRATLRMYLQAHLPGVEVMEAAGGLEALGLARDHPIDVVLTDYLMPEMNGLDMLEELARIQESKAILLTAYPDATVIRRALDDLGAQVIMKPADPWQIAVAVAQQLGMQAVPAWSAGEGVPA